MSLAFVLWYGFFQEHKPTTVHSRESAIFFVFTFNIVLEASKVISKNVFKKAEEEIL